MRRIADEKKALKIAAFVEDLTDMAVQLAGHAMTYVYKFDHQAVFKLCMQETLNERRN